VRQTRPWRATPTCSSPNALLVSRNPALSILRDCTAQPDIAPYPGRVACHVNKRTQKGRYAYFLQRCRDSRIRISKRLADVWLAIRNPVHMRSAGTSPAPLAPSMVTAAPLMYEAASEARKRANSATSSGCPTRPIG
jgi:hypothetical protein